MGHGAPLLARDIRKAALHHMVKIIENAWHPDANDCQDPMKLGDGSWSIVSNQSVAFKID